MVLILCSCNHEYYQYGSLKYRLYRSTDLRKKVINIKALDLSNEEGIPNDLYLQNQLLILNLADKNLKDLDAQFCQLTSLRVLILTDNQGIRLPGCVSELRELEVLSLLGCRLESIPPEIKNMPHLKTLVLSGNDLSINELKSLAEQLPNTSIIDSVD